MSPDLISVREAASRLGVTHPTLYRWLHSDHRPDFFVQVGERWKVSVPRLEEYVR